MYLHRWRKICNGGNEYSIRSIHCDLDSMKTEALAAGGVQVENLGNHGFEMQLSE